MPSDALKNLFIANAPQQTEGERAKANIATARAAKNAEPRTLQSARQTSNPTGQAPITAAAMAPVVPVTLAEPTTPTQGTTLSAEIQGMTDDYTKNLEAEAANLKTGATSGVQSYLDKLSSSRGLTARTDTAYRQAGGVDDVQVELNDINDQIRRKELAERRAIEAIQARGGGLKAGAQSEIANIQRASLSERADLAIIQMAVQGRYDSAKAIADRAVSAELEQQTNDLEIAKFNYEENKDLFTKAEQRAFEAKAADRERTLTEQKENKTAIYDLAIQAQQDGAPTAVVQNMMSAKTKEEAAALGGSYIGALEREAQRANIAQSYASIETSRLTAQKTRAEIAALNETETGSNNIAVQALDSFSGTLNENNREQFTKALSGSIKRGNVEQTETALKNAAQAAAGSALREDVIKRDQAIGALRKVQSELAAYQEAGGNTNLLTGGYEDLQNKLGKTGDPKLAAIETRINLALNAYTNAVSGASFTPQESQRYASLFPSTSNTNELNTTKLNTLVDSFEANNQVFYGNFYGGYTPSQLAEQAVYDELVANATPEQLAELGITQ